jgi:DNA-binding NarL/FixJ family response regulator
MITAARPAPSKALKVLIIDDQTLFRNGLALVLGADPRLSIVGEAGTGAEALQMIAVEQPDVVLLDVKMPKMDGIETTKRITAQFPHVKVLILTSFDHDGYVVQALKSGASGYLLKDCRPEAIVAAILTIVSGERVMTREVADHVLDMITGTSTYKERYDGLTRRELEILRLLASGLANKQIARELQISEKTVRNHISSFYAKLGVGDRSQAILYAVRKGLVEP